MPNLEKESPAAVPNPAAYQNNYKTNIALFLGVLIIAYVLMKRSDLFDRPFIRLANGFSGINYFFDLILYYVYANNLLSGVVFMSIIWGSWFEKDNIVHRSRILIGTLASSAAGVISRFLQHTLQTHPRPYYDPDIIFRPPLDIKQPDLNTWNSFPSDTASVYTGLVTVIWLSSSRFRVAAALWLIIVLIVRSYNGAHYPTDLIAGVGLGATLVWCSQAPWLLSSVILVTNFEKKSPTIFYALAFLVTYQIANLFSEARTIVGGFSIIKRIF